MSLIVDRQRIGLTGTIKLSSGRLSSRSIAYFNASATENRISTLDGYYGAAIFTALADDEVFELVLWKRPEAIAAVRNDPRFSDHVGVLEPYVEHPLLCFSPMLLMREPVELRRGQRWTVSAFALHGAMDEAVRLLQAQGLPGEGDLIHVAPGSDGARIVHLASGEAIADMPCRTSLLWRSPFEVVEAFDCRDARVGGKVAYRLLPPDGSEHHG